MKCKPEELVTIVIPCYRQTKYLSRALKSINNQTYKEIEVIIIDDGNIEPILISDIKCNFPVKIARQPHGGPSKARNKGIELARGAYIMFLDADDEILPFCLTKLVSCHSESANSVTMIGFKEILEETGCETHIVPAFGNTLDALLMTNIGPIHSFLHRTSIIKSIGGFSTEPSVEGGHEDYDLHLRLAMAGVEFVTIHDVGVIYYKRRESRSTNRERMHESRALVWTANVLTYLERKDASKALEVILIALCSLLSSTLEQYRQLITPATSRLEDTLARETLELDKDTFTFLIEHLNKFKESKRLSETLSQKTLRNSRARIVHHQAIVDHRFVLTTNLDSFSDGYIIGVLQMGIRHKGRLGIYGIGEMGKRLLRILLSAKLIPIAIFDLRWRTVEFVDGIIVVDPSTIADTSCTGLVVATFSEMARAEILQFISQNAPHVEVV